MQEGDANAVYARGYVQSKFTTLWPATCFLLDVSRPNPNVVEGGGVDDR